MIYYCLCIDLIVGPVSTHMKATYTRKLEKGAVRFEPRKEQNGIEAMEERTK